MGQYRSILLMLAVSGAFLIFQNCSQANFTQSSGSNGPNSGAGLSGGPDVPLTGNGTNPDGSTTFTVGGGGNPGTGAGGNPGTGGGTPGTGNGGTLSPGSGGSITIAPPQTFPSPCSMNYPFVSANPATNVPFNESEVLIGYSPASNTTATNPDLAISMWYADEHAMTLGVRQINVTSSTGTTTQNYMVSPLNASPDLVGNPSVGATSLTGMDSGTDSSMCPGVPYVCSRPMFPALFVTDITGNPGNTSGDWQNGGTPVTPTAIFGVWKAAVKNVDITGATPVVKVVPDADPTPNGTNLGGIPTPPGVTYTDGGCGGGVCQYSAVVSWKISQLGLTSGHTYRFQFMVHDGDQNNSGGDVGENCTIVTIP